MISNEYHALNSSKIKINIIIKKKSFKKESGYSFSSRTYILYIKKIIETSILWVKKDTKICSWIIYRNKKN